MIVFNIPPGRSAIEYSFPWNKYGECVLTHDLLCMYGVYDVHDVHACCDDHDVPVC